MRLQVRANEDANKGKQREGNGVARPVPFGDRLVNRDEQAKGEEPLRYQQQHGANLA